MKILVTGGSGFLGKYFLEKAINEKYEVINFDLKPFNHDYILYENVVGNILHEIDIEKIDKNIDCLIHNLAAVPLIRDKKIIFDTNILGTKNILDFALRTQIKKIIFISSSAVYGSPPNAMVLESSPTVPFDQYGKSKLQAEEICLDYIKKGLDITIVRPRTILGESRRGLFGLLFEWISKGYKIPILGDGKNIYQFVDANDVANFCMLAAHEVGPQTYNIGASNPCSLEKSLNDLIALAKSNALLWRLPKQPTRELIGIFSFFKLLPFAEYQIKMYSESIYFNNKKAFDRLGWRPSMSNTDCLLNSYKHFVNEAKQDIGSSVHTKSISSTLLKFAECFLRN